MHAFQGDIRVTIVVPATAATPAPEHQLVPGGLGGVRMDQLGVLQFDQHARDDARNRMWNAVGDARPGGIPMAVPGGDLPPGIYRTSWKDVTNRYSTPTSRRVDLTAQLGRALGVMHEAGVQQAVVGGSYVGAKLEPGDVDVAIIARSDAKQLNVRRIGRRISAVAPDVHVHAGWGMVSNANRLPGATPGANFLEFFQHTRDGAPRGALLLEPAPGMRAARELARLVGS